MIKRLMAAALVATCAMGSSADMARATPLNLIEGATDFDTTAPAGSVLGTLGVGTNTFTGSIDFNCTFLVQPCDVSGNGDDFDTIRLRLAAGTQLVSGGNLTVTNADLDGNVAFFDDGDLVVWVVPFGGLAFLTELNNVTDGPADLSFGIGVNGLSIGATGTQRFDYTLTFNVIQTGTIDPPSAQIPLPASGILLLAALGAGVALRRRGRA